MSYAPSHTATMTATAMPMTGIDRGRIAGFALVSVISLGLVLLLATAATASDCVGTAMSAADVTLPVLTG